MKQDLDDEIATRKMDEKGRSGQTINAVASEGQGDSASAAQAEASEPECVETEVWVEELEAWVCGLAPKRPAPTDGDTSS